MGDEKFFALMKNFIQKYYFQQAGIRDLQRLAEKFYGESIRWFFDQWVYGTGIPEYRLTYRISPAPRGKYRVSGHIAQELVRFRMPLEVVAVGKDQKQAKQIWVRRHGGSFRFLVPFKPDTVLLDPEFKVLRWDNDIKVWVYTWQGRKLHSGKKYDEAEKLLDTALEMNPGCSWAAFERASLADDLEQYQLAIQYHSQALEGDRDYRTFPWTAEQMEQTIYLSQGMCYDLLRERQEAMACYQKAVKMGKHPISPQVYHLAKKYIKEPYSKP